MNSINYISSVKICMECDERYWVETGCDCGAKPDETEQAPRRYYDPQELTPIHSATSSGGDGIWLKRDDLCAIKGASGGKARTCWSLAQKATKGLVTAGSRSSPQAFLVASMANALGLPCVIHCPTGDISSGPVYEAEALGAYVVQHKPGYNSVIIARCRTYAQSSGYTEIPFGMECGEAVTETRQQVKNIPAEVARLVVPVGSGMSLAGILWGMIDTEYSVPVLGVVVGANPEKRLDKYAPSNWRDLVQLVTAPEDYHTEVQATVGSKNRVSLDPNYEAKCARYLREGDLLWIVGHRKPIV